MRSRAFPAKAAKSAASKRNWSDPKFKEQMSATQKEAQNRPKTKEKRSESIKKSWEDPEIRESRLSAQKEACNTEEHKVGLSKRAQELNKDPEYKESLSAGQKEAWKDPEKRQNRLDGMKGAMSTPEYRAKQRERTLEVLSNRPDLLEDKRKLMQAQNQDPEFKKKVAEGLAKSGTLSDPHKRIWELMKEHDLDKGFKVEQWIGKGMRGDIVHWEAKLIIEFNGCYWHVCEQCYPDKSPLKDKRVQKSIENWEKKLKFIKENGWTLVILWGHDNEDHVLETIKDAVKWCWFRDATQARLKEKRKDDPARSARENLEVLVQAEHGLDRPEVHGRASHAGIREHSQCGSGDPGDPGDTSRDSQDTRR